MSMMSKVISTAAVTAVAIGAFTLADNMVSNVRFARASADVQASREQLKSVEDFSTVYKIVGKAVEPSVVSITVHKSVKRNPNMTGQNPLRQFFPDRDGDGEPDVPEGFNFQFPDEDAEQIGQGSGVILESSGGTGYILTNNHVAGGAESMTITLSDGREITKAKVVGTDPKSDLALIKIEADRLIPAPWGDSDTLEKGDVIMAFGSPFGYVGSMTHGIVSALNRQAGILGQNGYENFIQVDAPINPGNSGGPLVNIRGQVVGINTAIASRTGSFNGIGFAIPSNQAKVVFNQLKEHGKVTRGYIGVKIQDVSRDVPLAQSFGYTGNTGVLVVETYEDTPATGKLESGDIVTAIDGKEVKTSQQLRTAVAAARPDQQLTFTVTREGKSMDVKITIGEQPDDMASLGTPRRSKPSESTDDEVSQSPQSLGLKLGTASRQVLERYGIDQTVSGALVTSVEPKSPAAKAGLKPGDVITKIGTQPVTGAADARNAIAEADLAKGIRFYVQDAQGARFVFVKSEN